MYFQETKFLFYFFNITIHFYLQFNLQKLQT
jgi:hypothetical protein